MNKWTNFREKSPLLIWCSKNEGLLEILIHARASRSPWIPWRIEKCKSSVTPLTSYLPSSPRPDPWGVCNTCSSHSWVWNVSFLNQMLHISGEGRFALHEGARTEARGLCNSNFSDGTTYQETDFTCSWIMIHVWPKSSDFHSCKDQSDKRSWCKRRDVRSLNGITSTHPWKPHPQQYVTCEDRWGDHITQLGYPTCQQGQEGQDSSPLHSPPYSYSGLSTSVLEGRKNDCDLSSFYGLSEIIFYSRLTLKWWWKQGLYSVLLAWETVSLKTPNGTQWWKLNGEDLGNPLNTQGVAMSN